MTLKSFLCLSLMLSAVAPAAAEEGFSFRTPTGNILCGGRSGSDGSQASCFIKNIDARIPKRPADCSGGWGHEFLIMDTSEVGERICHSSWSYDDDADVLDYGKEIKAGDITCTSERSGVTCINGQGKGFEVARLRQDLF